MSKPQTQAGYVYEANNSWHIRFYVHEAGIRKQRSLRLCVKDDLHPSKESQNVQLRAANFMRKINEANAANDARRGHKCPICKNRCKRTIQGKFATKAPGTEEVHNVC